MAEWLRESGAAVSSLSLVYNVLKVTGMDKFLSQKQTHQRGQIKADKRRRKLQV